MACFSCGKTFSGDDLARVRRFKKLFDEKGLVSYYYRLSTEGKINVVRANGFKAIYETRIKPNFDKGAEYAHISEFQ